MNGTEPLRLDCNIKLNQKAKEWLSWDKNETTRGVVAKLVEEQDVTELEKLLGSRLMFGTAGLRGRMGAGYCCMNDLVIIQTTQGFCHYLLTAAPGVRQRGVIIGYDSRHNSHRFAQLAASVFLHADIPVYLFSQICPTPFVPFAVMHFSASAGIMVTASHNPKDDNGYKVYWSNGAQIISPHDQGIQAGIEVHLEPGPSSWDVSVVNTSPLSHDPLPDVMQEYYTKLKRELYDTSINDSTKLTFTTTAMHGVGHRYLKEAFHTASFKPFVAVTEQSEPDPDFPTVVFPNPEEGRSALDLSFKTADLHHSTVILANDPDADRLAVAEKQTDESWKVFTGNEVGALLGWWNWFVFHKKNPAVDPKECFMIASTVSSKLLEAIAAKEGFNFLETLTGFKWMGNKAAELESLGKHVLFAFEEAIGFMNGTMVRDKDGISAAVRVAEMAAYLEGQGSTLTQGLQNVYTKYGYHCSNNSYYLCYDPNKIKQVFSEIRDFRGSGSYPTTLCERYHVTATRDLTTGYDSSQPDGRAILPVSSSSQMVTFRFSNGCVLTLRTSGTEPKIKYYSEMCAQPGRSDVDVIAADLDQMVTGVVGELLQPDKFGLIPKSD